MLKCPAVYNLHNFLMPPLGGCIEEKIRIEDREGQPINAECASPAWPRNFAALNARQTQPDPA